MYRPTNEVIQNVRDCIRDAGGVPVVAYMLGLRDWAVRKWFNSGVVPVSARGNRVADLIRLARKAGHDEWQPSDLRPDIFDFE